MLGILADTFGPVFAKEAVEVVRRKRYYLTRTLYGLALLITLFAVWDEYAGRLNARGVISNRAMAEMAQNLFLAVSGVQFAAVFVFVPLFTSGVLAGEREAHTLDLLFTTRLTDGQLVLGKLFARLAVQASLILAGVPVLSLVMFLGGVDPDALLRSAAVTLLAALFVGAHAIYFSAVTRSPLGALVRTYWWLAIELLVVPGVVGLMVEEAPRGVRNFVMPAFLTALIATNPVVLFGAAVEGFTYDQMASVVGEWFFPAAFVLPAAWSVFLIRRAILRVRRDPVPFRLPVLRFRGLAFAREFLDAFDDGLAELGRRTQRAGRAWNSSWDRNPLWARARQARVYDREGYIGRVQLGGWLVAFTFFFLIAVFEPRELGQEEMAMVFLAFAWGGVAVLGVLLAGASLASDRSRGFLDLMLVTPLTARQVIDGTLLAVWQHLRRVFWLPWVLAFLFCMTGASLTHGAACSVITASLFLALAVLYGVGFSLSARSVPAGLAAAFVFALAVNAGTGALIGTFEEGHAVVLWPLSAALLIAGRWWFRRSASCAAVCCYLLGVHLALASLATVWTCDFRRDEFPGAAMHAGFLTVIMMDDNFQRELRDRPWFVVLPCYWMALAVNFLWARHWLIRHFDRLVGRDTSPPVAGSRAAPGRGRVVNPVPVAGTASPTAESVPSTLARHG